MSQEGQRRDAEWAKGIKGVWHNRQRCGRIGRPSAEGGAESWRRERDRERWKVGKLKEKGKESGKDTSEDNRWKKCR